MINKSKRSFMNINVILSFNTEGGKWDDTQEFFDMKILVSNKDVNGNAIDLLNKKFFHRIEKACLKLNRSPKDLIKISTCSDWGVYEKITGNISLCDAGHSCKWFFGTNRNDLDSWETSLMSAYKFGMDADMSWLEDYSREKAKKI